MWHFLHAICFLTLPTHVFYLRVISGSRHYLPLPLTVRMVQQSPSGWVTFWVLALPSNPTQEIQWPSAGHLIYMFCLYANRTVSLVAHKCCSLCRVQRDTSPCCWGAESFRVPQRGTCRVSGVLKAMGSIISSMGVRRKIAPEFLPPSFLTLAHHPRPSHSLLPECIWNHASQQTDDGCHDHCVSVCT